MRIFGYVIESQATYDAKIKAALEFGFDRGMNQVGNYELCWNESQHGPTDISLEAFAQHIDSLPL